MKFYKMENNIQLYSYNIRTHIEYNRIDGRVENQNRTGTKKKNEENNYVEITTMNCVECLESSQMNHL